MNYKCDKSGEALSMVYIRYAPAVHHFVQSETTKNFHQKLASISSWDSIIKIGLVYKNISVDSEPSLLVVFHWLRRNSERWTLYVDCIVYWHRVERNSIFPSLYCILLSNYRYSARKMLHPTSNFWRRKWPWWWKTMQIEWGRLKCLKETNQLQKMLSDEIIKSYRALSKAVS